MLHRAGRLGRISRGGSGAAPSGSAPWGSGSLTTGSTSVISVNCTLPVNKPLSTRPNRTFRAVANSAGPPAAGWAMPTSDATRSREGKSAILMGPSTRTR
ncbi:hypothetical protein AUC69_00560 [Methyloceanibacter superfactus]|uniref:Uncharacterized protein n=1 Tax=Methyloceanibacter superfactus TaxID=1774969 RepID=A0A1E3W3M8_9HYPH|nr:hypothetical protein AUC69_00560 [Methyloceanibacter superfactus]